MGFEIYVNHQKLDFDGVFAINYKASAITDESVVTSTYTTNLKIPNTPTNLNVLGDQFNPNTLSTSSVHNIDVVQDSLVIIYRGKLVIKSATAEYITAYIQEEPEPFDTKLRGLKPLNKTLELDTILNEQTDGIYIPFDENRYEFMFSSFENPEYQQAEKSNEERGKAKREFLRNRVIPFSRFGYVTDQVPFHVNLKTLIDLFNQTLTRPIVYDIAYNDLFKWICITTSKGHIVDETIIKTDETTNSDKKLPIGDANDGYVEIASHSFTHKNDSNEHKLFFIEWDFAPDFQRYNLKWESFTPESHLIHTYFYVETNTGFKYYRDVPMYQQGVYFKIWLPPNVEVDFSMNYRTIETWEIPNEYISHANTVLKVHEIKHEQTFDITSLLPNITIGEVLKEISMIYDISIQVDEDRIRMKMNKEIYRDFDNAIDWSEKLVQIQKTDIELPLAQVNRFEPQDTETPSYITQSYKKDRKYKPEDDTFFQSLNTENKGEIDGNPNSLNKEDTYYSSPFTSRDYPALYNKPKNVEKEGKPSDKDKANDFAVDTDTSMLTKITTNNEYQLLNTYTGLLPCYRKPYYKTEFFQYQNYIDSYYYRKQEIFQHYRKVTIELLLKPTDLKNIDYLKLYYFEQIQRYAILQEIKNYVPNKTCKATFILI